MRRRVGKCMLDVGSNGTHWWSRSGHCEGGIGRRGCEAEGILEAEACWSRVSCMPARLGEIAV